MHAYFINLFIALTIIASGCDVGVYDYRLKVNNKTSQDYLLYFNEIASDTSRIGSFIITISAYDTTVVPLPKGWENHVRERDSFLVSLVKGSNISEIDTSRIRELIYYQYFLSKAKLDSLDWMLVIK